MWLTPNCPTAQNPWHKRIGGTYWRVEDFDDAYLALYASGYITMSQCLLAVYMCIYIYTCVYTPICVYYIHMYDYI